MRCLIIGAGEVGKSLFEVLKNHHETYIKDLESLSLSNVVVLNICIPYSDDFLWQVREYQKQYTPTVTIIHSTVPVGTSRALESVHSPIHGKHPDLSNGIKTFVKYVGGADKEKTKLANKFLREAHIKTRIVSSPEASELSKILCTTQYGWQILINKEIKRICDILKVDFEEVYGWNKHYNKGYTKLGTPQFVRPTLAHYEGKIGGHCVVNNTRLLDSWLTDTLRERNETY